MEFARNLDFNQIVIINENVFFVFLERLSQIYNFKYMLLYSQIDCSDLSCKSL